MNQLLFQVQGSQLYSVKVTRLSEYEVAIYCDCPAGISGTHCKHRVNILMGEVSQLQKNSRTEKDLLILKEWLSNTKLEHALIDMLKTERELENLKTEFKNKKRKLARIMSGK